jgi:hypothetical protein
MRNAEYGIHGFPSDDSAGILIAFRMVIVANRQALRFRPQTVSPDVSGLKAGK